MFYLGFMPLRIDTLIVGPFAVNCYLVRDKATADTVVIDPGAEPELLISRLTEQKALVRGILLTHGHGDHIAAVRPLKEHCDVPLYVGTGEEELLANPSANVSALFDMPITAPPPDVTLTDEQVIPVGSLTFRVLATPGHSPGGVCYLHEEAGVVFCGDTLFAGSIGRTDFPGCSHERLLQSITEKLLTLPDNIICYPGHGPSTTIGAERAGNPFLAGGYFA